MTQTSPAAPYAGIPALPVRVSLGVISQVPFPNPPHGGPTPLTFPWVVLLNSSPYTIVVSTGATTTQIAAQNSDKVYIYPNGSLTLTVTPVAGFGTPNPGSDSTVYATFYHDEPPGQYPATLGPSAALATQQSIITQPTVVLGAFNSTTFPSATSNFSAQGFGGLSIFLAETSTNGPVQLAIVWTDEVGNILGQRVIVCPAGGTAAFCIPHIGPAFFIVVTNLTAGNISYNLNAYQQQIPTASWNLADNNILIPLTIANPGAGAFATIGPSTVTYAGPARWWYQWGTLTNGTCDVEYQIGNGNWLQLNQFVITAAVPGEQGQYRDLLLPPNPVRIRVFNNTGGAANFLGALTSDDWRIAA